MWHALHALVSNAPNGSLNSDAVIEILIGILGCMIGVLTLFVALAAIFGFTEIRKAAIRAAGKRAAQVASEIAQKQYPIIFAAAQASSLAESQAEDADQKKDVVQEPDTQITNDNTFEGEEPK